MNTISALGGQLVRVSIDDFGETDAVFMASISLLDVDARREVSVDVRPSDAIAVALVSDVPIILSSVLLEKISRARERGGAKGHGERGGFAVSE